MNIRIKLYNTLASPMRKMGRKTSKGSPDPSYYNIHSTQRMNMYPIN
jgi:hypothetical protein